IVSRSRSVNPAWAVRSASSSMSGHGRSGLTWSGVSGETPPQSSMPARRIRSYCAPTRLGGAWMRALAPRMSLVTAIVAARSSSSASGVSRILVSGLARKFCTMTSWMPWYSRATFRMAKTDSARSARVSPMPMRMPVVNGMLLRPARDRGERAVAAAVPAQPGQRDEDLARVGDDAWPVGGLQARISGAAGVGQQGLQVLAAGVQQDRRLVHVERLAVPGPGQRPAHGRGRDAVSFAVLPRLRDLARTRVAAGNTHARTLRGELLRSARPLVFP